MPSSTVILGLAISAVMAVIVVVLAGLVIYKPQWFHLNGGSPSNPNPPPGTGTVPDQTTAPNSLRIYMQSNLGIKGSKIHPQITFQGLQAWKATYRAGVIHSGGVDLNFSMTPPGVFPCTEATVSFKLWFADSFDWTATKDHSVGGKLGGFGIGYGDASGGNYSTTGASLRLTFKDGGQAIPYLYPVLRHASSGNGSLPWSALDQSTELQQVSYVAAGIHVFGTNAKMYFKKGQWNPVTIHIKLNDPGAYNGLLEMTVNGTTQSLNTVRYRYSASTLINNFDISTFFGGSTNRFAPPVTTQVYFADYHFASNK